MSEKYTPMPAMFRATQSSDALMELKASLGELDLTASMMGSGAVETRPKDEVVQTRTVTRTRKVADSFDYEG